MNKSKSKINKSKSKSKSKINKSKSKSKNKAWSKDVTMYSNALILDSGVFTWTSPKKIALSLKRSADISRKSTSFRSAMSMLNFYINRAGNNLTPERKKVLNEAKIELRKLYGKS
jgi:hypothetical protein